MREFSIFGVKMNEMRGIFIEFPDSSNRFEYLIQRPRLKYEFWIMCRKVHDSSKMNGLDAFPTTKLKAKIKSKVLYLIYGPDMI